jgi:hypothetical protein
MHSHPEQCWGEDGPRCRNLSTVHLNQKTAKCSSVLSCPALPKEETPRTASALQSPRDPDKHLCATPQEKRH